MKSLCTGDLAASSVTAALDIQLRGSKLIMPLSHEKNLLDKTIGYIAQSFETLFQPKQEPIPHELKMLAEARNINPNIFIASHLSLEDPLEKHVSWAFENIYSLPYNNMTNHEEIARPFHGIQHVTRSSIYVPAIIELYKKYAYPKASDLTQDEIKLLQIAAIFHDAGREGDGDDKWDKESALLTYFYLKDTLHIDEQKAIKVAEAVANKDAKLNQYQKLSFDKSGYAQWQTTEKSTDKNMYQKTLHDVDCLEVIRDRYDFHETYLDFYKDIAKKNKPAYQEMKQLITEVKSLIEFQGDAAGAQNETIKKKFEQTNAYHATLDSINQINTYQHLFLKNLLLPEKNQREIKTVNPSMKNHLFFLANKLNSRQNLSALEYNSFLTRKSTDQRRIPADPTHSDPFELNLMLPP